MSEGKIKRESFFSNILNLDWQYNIYLPADYNENNKYNLLYMLHGAEDTYHHWVSHGVAYQTLNIAIESQILEPTIVVFPDGSPNGKDSWYITRVYLICKKHLKKNFLLILKKSIQ